MSPSPSDPSDPSAASRAAAPPEVFQASLSNCEREPIHTPGSIQPHGALVAFDAKSGSIVHASANLSRWLPVGPLPLGGRTLPELLGADGYDRVVHALSTPGALPVRHEIVQLPARPDQGQPEALQALVHMHHHIGLVELEPLPAPGAPADWLQPLSDTVDALRSAENLDNLLQRMALLLKRITGLDRVMVYRFDAEYNGQVVADAREPGMESFLDLHYPASDIPAQARDLYMRNLVRYVSDVDDAPVAVLPCIGTTPLQPLDMSHAALRSVSPMHLQYLRNMGVRSTLTLSLLVEGRLWGLIAGHHRTPTVLPLGLRRACHALAVTAGYMTGWFAARQQQAETAQRANSHAAALHAFNQVQAPLRDVVDGCSTALCDLAGATGGALWSGNTVVPFGHWPNGPRSESVLHWLRHAFEASQSDVIFTEHVDLQPALELAELRQVCGLAAIRFDGFTSAGMVWLRPEHRREVLWGGDPDKPVQVQLDARGQPLLSPRSSFAQWAKSVTGRCRPWSDTDRAAVASMAGLAKVLAVRESLAHVSLSDKFRSLLALQSDAYWQTDTAGLIRTFSKPLPFLPGEPLGRSLPELFVGVCEAEGIAALVAALGARLPFRGLRLTGPSGPASERFGLQISGEPTEGAQGAFAGWQGVLSDVSHELHMEAALREKVAAELASLTKSKFLSQVSHELRTPLNAVIGFSQLVINDPTTPAAQRKQVEHVFKAGHWLLTMITDLLDLSKIETGNLAVAMCPVELSPLFDEIARLVAPLAVEHGVRLAPPEGADGVSVQADPARLRQVLVNLCSNAVKYNRTGGEMRLVVDARAAGQVRIDIIDNGEGLTPEQLSHLFEPFNRLGREAMNVTGTGIGLVISRQLLTRMGGTLDVASKVGVGSRFSVTLGSAAGPAPAQSEAATWPAAQPDRRSDFVLYVEDDPVNELLMRTLVESRLGYGYAAAMTAQEGLLSARERRPALMLVDLNLPDHNGLWLAAQVRADAALQAVRLVAVTADATPETRAKLFDNGFEDCWSKPLDLRVVAAQLRHLLEGQAR